MAEPGFPARRQPPLRGGAVLRWGVLGPGGIAEDFVTTVLRNTDQRVVAVGSRSAERAQQFATRHGIARAHPSYEALVSDPDVDIVYIATPHSEHHRLALLSIAAGKDVLVEKPIAVSKVQAAEIAGAARTAGVFAAEAMWTRYLPQFDVLHQLLERGVLGSIRSASADVGWAARPDTSPRLFDPAVGGGAALDMGVYGYWFAQFAIGRPDTVRAVGSLTPSGVDDQIAAVLTAGDKQAAVTTSMAVTASGLASISGTRGSARFLEPFVFPASFVLRNGNQLSEWVDTSGLRGRAGLAWQAAAVAGYVDQGLTDSPVHGLDDAASVLRTIDDVRAQVSSDARSA